ncbi:MAG: NADH-quinone oxidoreductase subunit D [Syntrophothermus sp.]
MSTQATVKVEPVVRTEELQINFGPQHPSMHGVFRVIVKLDGETITDATPVVGYLHRGIEKLAEARTYQQCIPYTDRLDYLASMSNNLAYVLAAERLAGIEAPERAQYLRVIMAELQRISSHLVFVGSLSNDLGAYTPWLFCFRDRELINDMFEMVSGARQTYNYMRIGGVSQDLPEGFLKKLKEFIDIMPARIDEYETLLTGNEIFLARTKGVGLFSAEDAISWGVSGPTLRASGVNYDIRKADPYLVYDRFKFDVPLGQKGDTFDRYMMRILEMRESLKILEQAMKDLPQGEIMAKVPKVFKPPAGEAYAHVEAPKGDLGFYLVSDGSTKPYRFHARRPSFVNVSALPEMIKGWKIADLIAIFASIDVVMGEIDA